MNVKLDDINRQILYYLRQDGRATFSFIAKEIGLSAPAVAERIKKMEDLGIIENYGVSIDYAKLGYQLRAIVNLRAFVGKLKPFLEKVKSYEEVLNCYRITGNDNIIMEVVIQDQSHLEKFIDRLIVYGECRTHIILSNVVNNAPLIKSGKAWAH